jgi:hypothetical protein
MKTSLPRIALIASVLALPAAAQDMALAQKWQNAKVVKYHVEGVHKARVSVVHGDYEGKADVLDRVDLDFTWDTKKRAVVGEVKVTDAKSQLSNIKSDKTNCPPPQLKGEYEHFQTVSHKLNTPEQIQISGTRTYSAASVSNYPASCSMRSIPGGTQKALLHVPGMAPEVLAMPMPPGGPISISADKKSFTLKGADNWVWTFTPAIVQ